METILKNQCSLFIYEDAYKTHSNSFPWKLFKTLSAHYIIEVILFIYSDILCVTYIRRNYSLRTDAIIKHNINGNFLLSVLFVNIYSLFSEAFNKFLLRSYVEFWNGIHILPGLSKDTLLKSIKSYQ